MTGGELRLHHEGAMRRADLGCAGHGARVTVRRRCERSEACHAPPLCDDERDASMSRCCVLGDVACEERGVRGLRCQLSEQQTHRAL